MKALFGINLAGGNCEICGAALNVLNSSKAGKEFLCKKCMSYVSRYFTKKKCTYENMVKHIRQRMDDKKKIESFIPSASYGEAEYIFINPAEGTFVISPSVDYKRTNSDIFSIEDIISCEKRIDIKKEEIQYKDSNGNVKSFVPQFMAYQYDFYIDIRLNLYGYDKIVLKLNDKQVDNNQETLIDMKSSGVLNVLKDALVSKSFDGMKTNNMDVVMQSFEYKKFDTMADQIVEGLRVRKMKKTEYRCPYCDAKLDANLAQCDRCGAIF
ncbi:MAG: hypothetical protein IKY23_12335 [Lachnospiraceae bacterium]|nr:hypothetical protein [Lachnospiraceae bacterium]